MTGIFIKFRCHLAVWVRSACPAGWTGWGRLQSSWIGLFFWFGGVCGGVSHRKGGDGASGCHNPFSSPLCASHSFYLIQCIFACFFFYALLSVLRRWHDVGDSLPRPLSKGALFGWLESYERFNTDSEQITFMLLKKCNTEAFYYYIWAFVHSISVNLLHIF